MSTPSAIVGGTVQADGTLEVQEKVNLPAGKVQVTLVPLPEPLEDDPFWQLLQGIWAGQKARGHVPRTVEEVEAERQACRGRWKTRASKRFVFKRSAARPVRLRGNRWSRAIDRLERLADAAHGGWSQDTGARAETGLGPGAAEVPVPLSAASCCWWSRCWSVSAPGDVPLGIESLPLYPEGGACRRPTARRVIDVFEEVQHHELSTEDKRR